MAGLSGRGEQPRADATADALLRAVGGGEPTTSAPSSTAPPAGLSTATAILVISREHVDGVSVIRDPGTLAAGEAVIAVDHPEPATHDAPGDEERTS